MLIDRSAYFGGLEDIKIVLKVEISKKVEMEMSGKAKEESELPFVIFVKSNCGDPLLVHPPLRHFLRQTRRQDLLSSSLFVAWFQRMLRRVTQVALMPRYDLSRTKFNFEIPFLRTSSLSHPHYYFLKLILLDMFLVWDWGMRAVTVTAMPGRSTWTWARARPRSTPPASRRSTRTKTSRSRARRSKLDRDVTFDFDLTDGQVYGFHYE